MKTKLMLLLTFLAVGLIGPVLAAEEPVKITGLNIHGNTEKNISYIEGNVRLVQGKTVLTTDKATVYTEKKQVFLERNVRLENPDGSVVADALEYDFRQKSGVFRGNVVMQRKAVKGSQKKAARKDPFTLRCDELFLETKSKNFTATNGRFEHKEFKGSADQLVYHDQDEELVFHGHVDLKRAKGETIKGEETRIYLKDKSFVATNQVKVQIGVDNEEKEPAKSQPTSVKNKSKKR